MGARLLKVYAKVELDQDPDLSYLGYYASNEQVAKVDRKKYYVIDRFPDYDQHYLEGNLSRAERSEYRYFVGSFNYTGELPEDREKYTNQDYQRMLDYGRGEWVCVGVTVVADVMVDMGQYQRTQRFTSPGVWGVEWDYNEESRQYVLEEIVPGEYEELRGYIKEFGIDLPEFSDDVELVDAI